jgi:hypothetical protein
MRWHAGCGFVTHGKATYVCPSQPSDPTRSFRVVHAEGDTAAGPGCVDGRRAQPTSPDPYVSTLLCRGVDGYLLSVDAATDAAKMRRKVAPFVAEVSDRFRRRDA